MPTALEFPTKSKVKVPPKNPRVVKQPLEKQPFVPSEYMRVAKQDTEEKRDEVTEIRVPRVIELLDIRDQGNQLNCGVPLDEPLFQPFPSEIIFQKFEPCKVYEQSLQLRNNDQNARLVKVTHESSAYFKIVPPKNPGDKIAPGMTCTFKIQFLPDERKDYLHEIVVVTDREKFSIPIRAINGRAILDFPDEVKFGANPVKNLACRTLFVRNIGDRECRFTCKTKGAFEVEPKHGVVPIGGNTQLVVNFQPITNGCHSEVLEVHYDTGEDLNIKLSGTAMDVNVRLDKSTVRMENTFISLTTKRTIGITNRSDIIAKFHWKMFPSGQDDEQFRAGCEQELNEHEEAEIETLGDFGKQEDPKRDDESSEAGHKRALLNRTFTNRRHLLQNEHLLFQDEVFSVFPMEGEVWPNTTLDCEVMFKPVQVENYEVQMFLEVTGRESRLPIRLHGSGVGPQIDLSFETLNVGNVFLGSKHFYEVILWNKGEIDAIYAIQSRHVTAVSRCFSFDQMEAFVPPGGYQAIKIELDACVIGPIDEVFDFQVDGMKDTAPKIFIRGQIVGPTFNFSVSRLKLGHIPFGFLTAVDVNLVNTSLVPLNFQLSMSEDGDYPAISGTEDNADFLLHSKPDTRKPQEFRINPTFGLVPAQSSLKISIGVLPNSLGKLEKEILVFIKDIEGCQLALPLTARVVVADLNFQMPVLNLGKCFLRYPYQQSVTLVNPTSIPARFELVPQDRNVRAAIKYDSPNSWGIIEGNSSVNVPMVFQIEEKGEQNTPVLFSVFGNPEFQVQFVVECCGEGPVALVEPTNLDWGKVKVLEWHPKYIQIRNESLISAKFKCKLRRQDSVFSANPATGVIEPGETASVTVYARPNDTFQFSDNLLVGFDESATQTVVLNALGFGPTIVTEPVIEPWLDFGPRFSQHESHIEVVVSNQGRRLQRVHFKIEDPNDHKNQNSKKASLDSCFKIVPNRLTLESNQSEKIKIVAYSQTECSVCEDLVATSIIGKLSGKETVLRSKLKCSFINPVVQFSTMKIHFEIKKSPGDALKLQYQELSFVNTSSLPITANFSINSSANAFLFLAHDGSLINSAVFNMGVGDFAIILVAFDPNYIEDSAHTRYLNENIEVTYSEHPNKDIVTLSSVVYFPNLDFETKIIHFGCVVNETEVTRTVKITNSSPLPVDFRWSFKLDETSSNVLVVNKPLSAERNGKNKEEKHEKSEDDKKNVDDLIEQKQIEVFDSISVNEIGIEEFSIQENVANDLKVKSNLLAQVDLDAEFEMDLEKQALPEIPEKGELEVLAKETPTNDNVLQKDADLDKNEDGDLFNDGDSQKDTINLTDLYDIHPLFGHLAPGESETVSFTFFGHVGVKSEVIALCDVEGGPLYELQLSGEASSMHYNIDRTEINLGLVRVDELCESEVVVSNTSKVELSYRCVSIAQMASDNVHVGCPVVQNPSGTIAQYSSVTVAFTFIPGIPERFQKSFTIQVSHFEPVEITIKGEGVFPRFALDLPRTIPDRGDLLDDLIAQAEKDLLAREERQNVDTSVAQFDAGLIRLKTFLSDRRAFTVSNVEDNDVQSFDFINEDALQKPSKLEVLMEMERLILLNHTSQIPKVYPRSSKPKFMGIVLPGYELDFGFVILGDIATRSVRLINNGSCPLSLYFLRSILHGSGFLIDVDRIKALPGAPDYEMTEFHVHFDPRGANLDLGPVECEVPIHVHNGPSSALILKAHVTMPSLTVSDSVLDFGQVLCSQCKIITVQFFNHKRVPCEWMVTSQSEESASSKAEKQFDWSKNQPWKKKKKEKSEKVLRVFEVIPNGGVLMPGERYNVQIKFMPLQQKKYEERLTLKISHSSYKVGIQCTGSGVELDVSFSMNFLEFGPCLPHSAGDEQEIVVSNPTDFPVEIYSVEFDNQYLEEEKTLRMMKGWDRDNCLLLPPLEAGAGLPKELTDFYSDHLRQVKLAEQKQAEKTAAALTELTVDDDDSESRKSSTGSRSLRSAASKASRVVKITRKLSRRDDTDTSDSEPAFDPGRHTKEDRKSTKSNRSDEEKTEAPADQKASKRNSEVAETPEVENLTPAPPAPNTGDSSLDATTVKINATGDGSSNPGDTSGTGNQTQDQTQTGSDVPTGPPVGGADVSGEVPPEESKDKGVGKLEVTPVTAAIARYLNIDLSAEGKAAENRRGIAIVVYGAPQSGKTTVAKSLQENYGLSSLDIDDVILSAIRSGESEKALVARQICAKAMYDKLHPEGSKTAEEEAKEAAAQKPAAVPPPSKAAAKGAAAAAPSEPAQPETLPSFPMPRKLTELDSLDSSNQEGFLSCHLPEDVLVDLVSERLQSRDCFKGVVFDGLESLFTPSILVTVQILLKAINNRKYIYFVETSLTQSYLKEQAERAKAVEQAHLEELRLLEQKRIEEMSEDEFEMLTPKSKTEVERKQLQFKREKMKRLEQEKEKLREEEEQKRLEEIARQEAERQAKKKKKADASKSSSQGTTDNNNNNNKSTNKSMNSMNQSSNMGATGRGASLADTSAVGDKADGKKKGVAAQPPSQPVIEEETPVVKLTEEEVIQNTRFKFYEMFKLDIYKLLERWDRTKGQTGRPLTPGDDEDGQNPRHTKRYKVGPPILGPADEDETQTEEAARGDPSEKDDEARVNMENLGVPLIQINVANPELKLDSCVFDARVLPSYEELHEGLGMGTTGPPVPPPATFSVVPFPAKRKPHIGTDPAVNFAFIAAGLEDPNLLAEKEQMAKKREEELREKEEALAKKGKKDKESSRDKDKSRTGTVGGSNKEKSSKSKKSTPGEDAAASATKKGSKNSNDTQDPLFGFVQQDDSALPRLNILRWVIPARGERTIRLRFVSSSAGQFDQTLHFELVGTKRRYQLHLRGVSCFPAISREPRVLFPCCKKVMGKKEIAKKCYVGTSNCFEFGPLLLNKKRDEKETMYPENMEKFCFFNDSLLDVELSLCFLQDSTETTFMMDKTALTLSAGERKEVTVWAYPKTLGEISDVIVCCVKDNPEPLLLKISCIGCKPQLEIPKVDGKVAFQFDKVLLHRKDTKTIPFRNPTKLPAAWKIIGMDSLRDDVTLSAEQGIVPPLSEVLVSAVFKASKAGPLPKKPVKMEVTDVDKIMGVVQTEQVVATGEAYDVLLDLIFPKGPEGGLDFGSCRVGDENIRQTLSLKNKGKYEIQYQFIFEQCGLTEDPTKFFSILPSTEGSLSPSDRPTNITLGFSTKKEISIKNVPIIKCKIVEPSQGDSGEVIAIIPIKVSVRAIFSRYKISPSHDLNFGPISSGVRRQKFFTIENVGEFDFKYSIARASHLEDKILPEKKGKRAVVKGGETARSRDASVSSKATLVPKGGKKSDANNANAPNAGQFKLNLEAFNLSPAFGIVTTGAQQVIQVEAYGDVTGHFEDELLIDISDRMMTPKTKNGVPFKLISDVCNPVIETSNMLSIFEEHIVCKNLRNYKSTAQHAFCGVFGEDENRFVFSNVIVGEEARARFKIINPSKVVADVTFSIKSAVQSKSNKQTVEVFEVSPQQASIAAHGHVYAVVTFSPNTMQTFNTAFEAMVDGVAQFTPSNYLTFDITGEATLPRLTVTKPLLQNSRGNPLVLFKRLLIGHAQTTPIVLTNEGELVCRASLDLGDASGVFKIEAGENVKIIEPPESIMQCGENEKEEDESVEKTSVHNFLFELQYKESATFYVTFVPREEQRCLDKIRVVVDKNNFEELEIVLVGEGYSDIISIDNVHGANGDAEVNSSSAETTSSMIDEADIKAPKTNHLNFGDVYLNEKKHMSFTLSNHSKQDHVRFQFPSDHAHLTFTPRVGHLRSNCAKDIVVAFRSASPIHVQMEEVICVIKKIKLLADYADQMSDWDDSMKTLQWLDIRREKTAAGVPSTDPLDVDRKEPSNLTRRRTGAASSDKSVVSKDSQAARTTSPKAAKSGSQRSMAILNPPFKRRMAQTEPEPNYEVIEGSTRDVELYYSAISDYCKFSIDSQSGTDIHFKDTLMFQSRIYEFKMENTSNINFEYEWQAVSESNLKSVSFAKELEEFSLSEADNHDGDAKESPIPSTSRSPQHRNVHSTQSNVSTVTSLRVSVMPDSATDFITGNTAGKPTRSGSPSDEDPELVPFFVEPRQGVIESGLTQTFKVKFCPLDVKEFNARLLCRIPNLEEGAMGPVLAVHGKSLLPYVHFDLEESDYLTTNKRSHLGHDLFTLQDSSVDPNTRVLEFFSCGVNRTMKRSFPIINPTKNPFFFAWSQALSETEKTSSNEFKCLKKSGQILAGKSIEALFEFKGRKLGSFETFWTFQIPKLGIEVPFLLVGHVSEPSVTLDRTHVNFKSLLIGSFAEETVYVVNHEEEAYKVSVDEASLIEPDTGEAVSVNPKSFSVPPKSRAPVKLRFYARIEKEVSFNVLLNVQYKSMPLKINLKAEGYAMDSQLFFHETENEKLELTHVQVTDIDFGEVEVNDKLIKTFSILNSGKYMFEYSWTITQPHIPSTAQSSLELDPNCGSIEPGDSATCILNWHPRHKYSLNGAFLNLAVKNGPKYKIALRGSAVKPSIKFSFKKYNFGYTFVASNEQPVKQCTLAITNHDCKTVNVDCLFVNQPHLKVSMESGTLEPESTCLVLFQFAPQKCVKYSDTVNFLVNGLTETGVVISGHGCDLKLDVTGTKNKLCNFGAIRIGQVAKKRVHIVNHSLSPVTFNLFTNFTDPALTDYGTVSMWPDRDIQLAAKNGCVDIELKFHPKTRVAQFLEEVLLEVEGVHSGPLFALTGCCQATEVTLDSDTIPFGAVTLNSSSTRKLVMTNSGDIGASFQWNAAKFAPDFSIQPHEGYISPGMEMVFDLTFHPQSISQEIRYDNLICYIEHYKPLKLSLTGMCVGTAPVRETLYFNASVRSADKKTISLANRSYANWNLRPAIDGEHWHGSDVFNVEAGHTKNYELVYKPQVMTVLEGKKHTGTLFFPMPDGSGLLYQLVGTADHPKPSGNITREVPCKTQYTELLKVTNWLQMQQRFKTYIEMVKPDKLDSTTTLKGLDYVETPAMSSVDFKLNFFAYREGTYTAKIVFVNERTREYQFFLVSFKSITSGVLSTIDLNSVVRKGVSYTLKVPNPLSTPVNAVVTSSTSELAVPTPVTLPPEAEGSINVDYLPLKEGENVGRVQVQCNELGTFVYEFRLKAAGSGLERPLFFKTTLGSNQSVPARVVNYHKSKTDFTCHIASVDGSSAMQDFTVEKTITASAGNLSGAEVLFDVVYEPSAVGDFKAMLEVSSTNAGDFHIPLYATCLPPKPQGPYVIKATSSTTILFKNIFNQPVNFYMTTDNKCFSVKDSDTIRAKKSHNILVSYEGNPDGSKNPKMGKLKVYCPRELANGENIVWIYYLKGITP